MYIYVALPNTHLGVHNQAQIEEMLPPLVFNVLEALPLTLSLLQTPSNFNVVRWQYFFSFFFLVLDNSTRCPSVDMNSFELYQPPPPLWRFSEEHFAHFCFWILTWIRGSSRGCQGRNAWSSMQLTGMLLAGHAQHDSSCAAAAAHAPDRFMRSHSQVLLRQRVSNFPRGALYHD